MISTKQWETFPDYAPEGVDLTELQLFGRIKDELTISQDADVILLGNHIVMPDSLHQRAISIAHESHQGPVKTKKKLLHEKKWFPKIDHDVREMINHPDPLQMSLLPPEPMAHCPHGHLWSIPDRRIFVCIVIDDYSQHPEV